MFRHLNAFGLGLVLLVSAALVPACAVAPEGDEEDVDIGQDDLAATGCPYFVTDPANYHATYVTAFNSDIPSNIGCLYEGNASFFDPLTQQLVTGRKNIENAIAPLMQGTTMTAYTRFGYKGGGDLWLGSASWVITSDADGSVVAAGQSADSLRKQSAGNWMQAIDLPFGGQ
jgi:ketosteroid isomerase-like protein